MGTYIAPMNFTDQGIHNVKGSTKRADTANEALTPLAFAPKLNFPHFLRSTAGISTFWIRVCPASRVR